MPLKKRRLGREPELRPLYDMVSANRRGGYYVVALIWYGAG